MLPSEAPQAIAAAAKTAYPIDPMPPDIAALRETAAPVWVFAYGSLMWNPGIPVAETRPALLRGFHRSFCLYSRDYRGTWERPGLVLGLDRGGACRGLALRLAPDRLAEAIDAIWQREMAGYVYRMRPVPLRTAAGPLCAYAFTVRRDHADYAGQLALETVAGIIATAAGQRGTGRDYLASTVRHLEALGIADGPLHRIEALVTALPATGLARSA